MDASTGHPDLRFSAERLLDAVETMLGPEGAHMIADFRSALGRPAVIAVTGRVNTGKSTLVNSLIGAKLAPTSARETTALLCSYTHGAPARAEASLDSGELVPLPLGPSGPVIGTLLPETIDYLRVYVQAAALERATIVDTPGLGSAETGNAARTEHGMFGAGDAPEAPDVLLYLVRDSFRPDDLEFIARFGERRRGGQTRRRPPVVGLVSHADNYGGGPWHSVEPVNQATRAAAELSAKMPSLAAVLPVSGLLAETVRTGALREQDVRNLRLLQGADDRLLQFAEQLGPPPGIALGDFRRLTGLIGAYGVRYGRGHCGSAVQLAEWLHERSGQAKLERTLLTAVTCPVEIDRVDELLTRLLVAARSQSWHPEVRRLIESARHAPAFHLLQEHAALELLRAAAPGHELVAVLQVLTQAGGEVEATLPMEPGENGYRGLAAHYQSMIGTASTGAEALAARVIARSLLIRSGGARNGP